MTNRFNEYLFTHMNIKSVYYYKSNYDEAGRVDNNKFIYEWNNFVAGPNDHPIVVNNELLGDPLPYVVKQLFINFTMFNDDIDIFTIIYNENEIINMNTLFTHIAQDTKILQESLFKYINIKSVYYYNSNYQEDGRVDHKFMDRWNNFSTAPKDLSIIVNNEFLGDTLPYVVKQLFINFRLFDQSDMFTIIYNENEIIDMNTLLTHIAEDTTIVNINHFHNPLIKCISYPYPHVVIDNFIELDSLPQILSEVNKLPDADAQSKYIDESSPYEFNKYVFNSNYGPYYIHKHAFNSNYGPYLRRLFSQLNSPDFIKQLEQITGVKNIICNKRYLHGTGIHRIKSKGFSQLRTEFNTYHSQNRMLDRRIKMLIYLNSDWKTEYKGHLCLCDKNTNMCVKKIEPILNRCVIFNTTSSSIHGEPEPLNVPNDGASQCIVVYYYTENTQGDKEIDFEGCSPRGVTWYPNIDVSARPTQIFYV